MEHVSVEMSAIQQRLESHSETADKKNIKCRRCGVNNYFSSSQWRIRCICGAVITRSSRQTPAANKIDCKLCHDEGTLTYDAQYEDTLYRYSVRCICQKGDKYAPLPLITDVDNVPGALMDKVNAVLFPSKKPDIETSNVVDFHAFKNGN